MVHSIVLAIVSALVLFSELSMKETMVSHSQQKCIIFKSKPTNNLEESTTDNSGKQIPFHRSSEFENRHHSHPKSCRKLQMTV